MKILNKIKYLIVMILIMTVNSSMYSQQPIRCADINNHIQHWSQFSVESMSVVKDSVTLTDGSGGSIAFNNTDFGGNWLESGCCKVCFDYKVDYNSSVQLTPPGNIVKMYTYTGPPITSLNDFNFGRTKAIYLPPTNEPSIEDNEWKNYCRPIGLSSNGQLPSDANGGYWQISIDGIPVSGTQACIAWDNLIQHVTGIVLATDYNAEPSEIISFKNFCWYSCTPPPQPVPCCNIENITATLIENDGIFNLNINSGNVSLQEVVVSMLDYHVEYNQPDCKPANMGIPNGNIGNISTTTTNLGSLVFNTSGNNSHVLNWSAGTPGIINSQIDFKVKAPSILNLDCCHLTGYFCIKIRVKDIYCNVCEKILCYPSTTTTDCKCKGWSGQFAYLGLNLESPLNSRPFPIKCGESVTFNEPKSLHISIGDYLCDPTTCLATYKWDIQGPLTGNGTGKPFNFSFSAIGTYLVSITPYCGIQKCEPCKFSIVIAKESNSCKCRKWTDEITLINWKDRRGQQTGTINCNNTSPFSMSDVCIGLPITGNFDNYICDPSNCQVKYYWVIKDPLNTSIASGSNTSSTNFSFIPTVSGNYILNITPECGNIRCPQCVVKIYIKNLDNCL
jgi:hypothetical protein